MMSERWAGPEKVVAGCDLTISQGRPQSMERHELISSMEPAEVMAMACTHRRPGATREAPAEIAGQDQLATRERQAGPCGVAERSVAMVDRVAVEYKSLVLPLGNCPLRAAFYQRSKALNLGDLVQEASPSDFYPTSCWIAVIRSRLVTGFSKNRLAPASRQRLSSVNALRAVRTMTGTSASSGNAWRLCITE